MAYLKLISQNLCGGAEEGHNDVIHDSRSLSQERTRDASSTKQIFTYRGISSSLGDIVKKKDIRR
jgi:hypothetical protein